jgi:gluconate 2-dehydrogenase gamma chain
MNCIASSGLSRRLLLTSVVAFVFVGAGLARARTVSGRLPWEPGTATPPVVVRPGPWMFFSADEAAMVEAAVDRVIPPDDRVSGGKESGCAIFINRQLAGPYGRSEGLYTRPPFMPGVATQGYQMADAPAARYRTGLRALADYIKSNFAGKLFRDLAPDDQDKVLKGLESGSIELKDVNGAEFFALLLANAQEGFFADPIYGGNHDMAGWKLIGFPGARYEPRLGRPPRRTVSAAACEHHGAV